MVDDSLARAVIFYISHQVYDYGTLCIRPSLWKKKKTRVNIIDHNYIVPLIQLSFSNINVLICREWTFPTFYQ